MGKSQLRIPSSGSLSTVAALCLSVCMPSAHALSLGRFSIQSLMGEPLRAEVEVTQSTQEELRSLSVQVGSPASFSQAGMEFHPALAGVKTQIERRVDGSSYIVLSGRTPILDTFVDLILETKWTNGKLTKNYAMLLTASNNNQVPLTTPKGTPPVAQPMSPAKLAVIDVASGNNLPSLPQASGVNAKNVPVYRFDPLDVSATNSQKPNHPTSAEQPPALMARPLTALAEKTTTSAKPLPPELDSHSKTITVPPGSTATQLVLPRLPSNVSLDQMLIALVQANPHAFIQGNVNLIRAGATLRIPTAEEAVQIDVSEARQTIVAQSRDFGAYARRMASASIQVDAQESDRKMSGRIQAQVKENTDGAPVQDKLTLTKNDANNKGSESQIIHEKKTKDEASQVAALTQSIEALGKLQTPDVQPEVQPDAPTIAPAVAPVAPPVKDQPAESLIERLISAPNAMAWAAALLALMIAFALYVLRRNTTREEFASSYPEYPSARNPGSSRTEPQNLQPEIIALDLNLNTPPAEEASDHQLKMAEQLITKGDSDLARKLLMSLITSPHASVKNRALDLLEQLK